MALEKERRCQHVEDGKSQAFTPHQLEEWSDEQLRQMLLAQMEAEEVDVELVRSITAILASREEEKGHEIEAHSAYEAFQQEYAGTPALFPEASASTETAVKETPVLRHHRPHRFIKAAIVAAVIMALFLGTTIVANASGLDLWGIITRWTNDVFGIRGESSYSSTYHQDELDVFYHLRTALAEYGVYQSVVPSYLPKGYSFQEISKDSTFEGTFIRCIMSNGDNEIILRYVISNTEQPTRYYTKDDVVPEIYCINSIEHHIMTNEQEYIISWTNENIVCDISGVLNYDDVILMIDSIYEGG
jgi:hypothetical protein